MDIQVKLFIQLWEVQVGRLGERQWQGKILGPSLEMATQVFEVIAVIKGERAVRQKRQRQGTVLCWLLWETELQWRFACRFIGELPPVLE